MKIIKNNLFYSIILLYFFSLETSSQAIEEVIIKGDWRETSLSAEDSSIAVLDSKLIESQALKHFENL